MNDLQKISTAIVQEGGVVVCNENVSEIGNLL